MLRVTKGCKWNYTRHQNFCWAKGMTALHRIKCVSEFNLEYAHNFLFSSKVFFLACTMLSVPPPTATPNCFAPNNSAASTAASFAMHLATRRRIISLLFCFCSVLFLFNAVNEALQKTRATKLGSWLLLAKFTDLVREFFACWGWSEIEQLIMWSRCSAYNLDSPAAVKFAKHWSCKRIFTSSNWKVLQLWSFIASKISFSLWCSFSSWMWLFLLSGVFPSNDRIFAAWSNCPWRKWVLAQDASASIVLLLLFFACFIETASFQRAAYSPDLHRSNLFIIEFSCSCLCFYPLCWKHVNVLHTAQKIFQSSTQSGFEMQSSIIEAIIPDKYIRNFTTI